jgi:hypothetical protein
MDMKKLLESMDHIELEGGMPMVPPMAPEDKGNPVTMNVSMNASGKEHVADLIDMMKNAGMDGAKEISPDMMPIRTDMERLRGIVDGPKDMDDLKPGMQDEPCDACGKQHVGASSCNDDLEIDDEAVAEESDVEITDEVWQQIAQRREELVDDEGMEPEEALEQAAEEMGVDPMELEDWLEMNVEGYDNEPDEEYKAIDDVINSGDDLHKSKDAYAATQDGDNPMAVEDEVDDTTYSVKGKSAEAQAALADAAGDSGDIREKLAARLKELMADDEGEHDHEDGEDCPECGAPGKQKLMACSSCGCS